ncbi:MAG: hypothetical protein GY751_14445 [Bacteroidetes bacterium]|nr:hypothetical protein [Bacteroidota bacterium]
MKESESLSNRLLLAIRLYKSKLTAIDGVTASQKTSKKNWSRKEILGHLVDSAVNNHRRFVLMHSKEDMVFEGYNQNLWVSSQTYQNRNWLELIQFWQSYNIHLAHIIRHYDERLFLKPFSEHNLHKVAFNTLLTDEPATISYLAKDYIDHLEFHLDRILR